MWWTLRWLLIAVAFTATTGLPVPDENIDTSTKVLGSSVVTSVSVVMGHEDGAEEKETNKSERKKMNDDLPASTVDMLKPDGFQFYTVDEKGQLITRQMTDSEIQSIIAAGGGPFPIETQDPQKTEENMTSEMKVNDVVQNVQNVLKEQLNKPALTMGTVPTIPGHANDEWSSILPTILGGDTDSAPVSMQEEDTPIVPVVPVQETIEQNVSSVEKKPATTVTNLEVATALPVETETQKEVVKPMEEKPSSSSEVKEPEIPVKVEEPGNVSEKESTNDSERPMIPVPVITAESVHSTMKDPALTEKKPVYQILNTISVEDVKTQAAPEKAADKEEEKIYDSTTISGNEKLENESKTPEVVEEQSIASSSIAVTPETTENKVTTLVPEIQKDVEKLASNSILKEGEKIGSGNSTEKVEPPVQETPSIALGAPTVAEEPPANKLESEKKPDQNIHAAENPIEDNKSGQTLAAVNENMANTPEIATASSVPETTSFAETIEQEVSEIASILPESINSIVEELISESTDKIQEAVNDKNDSESTDVATTLAEMKPAMTAEVTKIKESEEPKLPSSSNDKPEGSSSTKISSVVPAAEIPTKIDTQEEPVFQMLPEMTPEPTKTSTDTKIAPEVTVTSEIIENKPEKTATDSAKPMIAPESSGSMEKIEKQPAGITEATVDVTKVADSQNDKIQNSVPVELTPPAPTQPEIQTPAVSTLSENKKNNSGDKTTQKIDKPNEAAIITEKKPETLLTELADSVSSMISQVSEVMPSMVPIPQKTEEDNQSIKRVEDGAKPQAATIKTDIQESTTTISTEETKPAASEGESSVKIPVNKIDVPTNMEPVKPEKSDPEVQTMDIKNTEVQSEATQTPESISTESSIIVEAQKPEIPVSLHAAASTDSVSTVTNDKLDVSEMENPSKSENDTTKTTTSESAPIESVSTKKTEVETESEKEESKPTEETKTEVSDNKVEAMVTDGMKMETVSPNESLDAETPIVKLDITQTKPTESTSDVLSTDMKSEVPTESPVVRIQMTNPINIINQMIDSAPVQVPPVNVENIAFPENKVQVASAQNVGSGLIAGDPSVNPTEIKTPEDSTKPDAGNETTNNTVPTVSTSSEIEMTPTATIASDSKTPDVEILPPKTPEEENTKAPSSTVDMSKVTEVSEEAKPQVEKQVETVSLNEKPDKIEETKDSAASNDDNKNSDDTVKPAIRLDLPASSDKVESPEKTVETTTSSIEKINEPNNKVETVNAESSSKVTSDVIVDTPVKEQQKPDSINVEPVKRPATEESGTQVVLELQVTPEETEKKPEENQADNTATKITETLDDATQNSDDRAELVTPTSTQPDTQISDLIPTVSTPASENGDKVPEKSESNITTEKETNISLAPLSTPEIQADVKTPESNEKEAEFPADKDVSVVVENSETTQDVKSPVAEPELIPVAEIKPSKEENKADVNSAQSDIKETPPPVETTAAKAEESTESEATKDQASVNPVAPVVRIDVSPEKNQTETSTTLATSATEVTQKVTNGINVDTVEKPENNHEMAAVPETPVSEMSSSTNSDENSAMKITSTQPAVLETTNVLVSSSKTPAEAGDSHLAGEIKDDKTKSPVAKEPEISVVKTTEENKKETIDTVDPKIPEATVAPTVSVETVPSASPAMKIKTPEIEKPVVKIDTNLQTAGNNGSAETQEIRIQVNDTAVLVTKQKLPQEVLKVTEDSVKKTEVLDKPTEPTKVSSDKKPQSDKKDQESDKPSNEKVDNIKNQVVNVESTSYQKKPTTDPYVKLGEVQNDVKTVSLSNKNKENEGNKITNEKWTLIPQSDPYPIVKQQVKPTVNKNEDEQQVSVPLEAHQSAISLDESTRDLDKDIGLFSKLCNELAFSFWTSTNKGLSTARSLALSPFGMTSMLAMVFLGARGPTSGQMNDILKLDDVVTFNPHLVFQNVTDSVNLARGQGISNAAFVRELFSDRLKAGRLLPFYKERAQQFYDGHVEEVNFATISDLVRRRTNLLIRRQTGGRIRDFVKGNVMPLRSPLAALSANVFQTDCSGASSEGRDGEMYFAVLPTVRQRKLIPVPATVWRSGVLAGYEPGLDATVISLGGVDNLVSTIFLLPGQQGLAAPGDSLDQLERRLVRGAFTQGAWDRLLKVLIPRMDLEIQIPKFSHRSIVNATAALKRMGLDDLFSKHADLRGINGIGNDLHLADMLQINLFSTCGDESITGGRHHVEIYPASPLRGARSDKKTEHSEQDHEDEPEVNKKEEDEELRIKRNINVAEYVQQYHSLKKRSVSPSGEKELISEDDHIEDRSQRSLPNLKKSSDSKAKQTDRPMLKLDRPFLYFVRHNPTGMILHMGRFNPRLMP